MRGATEESWGARRGPVFLQGQPLDKQPVDPAEATVLAPGGGGDTGQGGGRAGRTGRGAGLAREPAVGQERGRPTGGAGPALAGAGGASGSRAGGSRSCSGCTEFEVLAEQPGGAGLTWGEAEGCEGTSRPQGPGPAPLSQDHSGASGWGAETGRDGGRGRGGAGPTRRPRPDPRGLVHFPLPPTPPGLTVSLLLQEALAFKQRGQRLPSSRSPAWPESPRGGSPGLRGPLPALSGTLGPSRWVAGCADQAERAGTLAALPSCAPSAGTRLREDTLHKPPRRQRAHTAAPRAQAGGADPPRDGS